MRWKRGRNVSQLYGHSRQGGWGVCQGISKGLETPNTPRQFNSPLTQKLFSMLKRILWTSHNIFQSTLNVQYTYLKKEITRKTIKSNSNFTKWTYPSLPTCTHEGARYKKKSSRRDNTRCTLVSLYYSILQFFNLQVLKTLLHIKCSLFKLFYMLKINWEEEEQI